MAERQERTIQALSDALGFRLTNETIVKMYDSDGFPYFTVTVGSGNHSVKALVKVKPFDATTPGKLDGIGLPQRVYSPNIVQVVVDTADTTANAIAFWLPVAVEAAKTGCKVEVYGVAAATNLALTDLVAGNLKLTIDDIQYPLLATT